IHDCRLHLVRSCRGVRDVFHRSFGEPIGGRRRPNATAAAGKSDSIAGEWMSTEPTGKRLELVRGLGPWASAAIVVGTMRGTGIFLKPAEMAREGRFVSVVFAAWIVGAILSIFGAFSFAELGSMIPEAGGEYAYLRRGFGPVYGFIFGWMHSIVGRPSSLASISAGMMRFLSFLLPVIAVPLFTVQIAIPGLPGWFT